ncbi:PIN domain-containing protein [Ditylenchus destructor]|nr:PIN domain-containing protein [Ditylenchus destructor]
MRRVADDNSEDVTILIAKLRRCTLPEMSVAEDVAKKLTAKSLSIAKQQSSELFSDLNDAYLKNLEQKVWKLFHGSIEALRKTAEIDKSNGTLSAVLVDYIGQVLEFYENLLQKYQEKFNVTLHDVFYWTEERGWNLFGKMENCFLGDEIEGVAKFRSGKAKLVICSAQRHLIAMGDLYRYRGQISKNPNDLQISKEPFNQLARDQLDVIFYYVMALSVKYPNAGSRDALEMTFSDIRTTTTANSELLKNYLKIKSPQESTKKQSEKPTPAKSAPFKRVPPNQQQQEIWIHPEAKKKSPPLERKPLSENGKSEEANLAWNKTKPEPADWIQDAKVQKLALGQILNALGILITNINMEEMTAHSQLSEQILKGFLSTPNPVTSAPNLVKLALIAISAVHHVKKGVTPTMAQMQQKYALGFCLNFFDLLLDVLNGEMEILGLYLLTGEPSVKLNKVLPGICLLSRWITSSATLSQFGLHMDSLTLPNKRLFSTIANTANKLTKFVESEELRHCLDMEESSGVGIEIILPEVVIASCFHDVFSSPPPTEFVQWDKLASCQEKNLQSALALHSRLYSVIQAAEILHRNGIVVKSESTGEYSYVATESLIGSGNSLASNNSQTLVLKENVSEEERENSEELDDEIIKQQLLEEEETTSQHKWILEVKPQYLIPDTNTFVDYLPAIKRIVASNLLTVLVPTTVIAELSSLAVNENALINSGFLSSEAVMANQSERRKYVMKQAAVAMDYFKSAAENGMRYLTTITSNGNVLPKLSFVLEVQEINDRKTNDDRILSACVALADKSIRSLTCDYENHTTTVKRNVVFLTEDRALSVKAIAARIPVRTVPQFLRWSGI